MNRNPITKFPQRTPTPFFRAPGSNSSIARKDADAFVYGAIGAVVAPLRRRGHIAGVIIEARLPEAVWNTRESMPCDEHKEWGHAGFGPVAYAQLAQACQCHSEWETFHYDGMVDRSRPDCPAARVTAARLFAINSRDKDEVPAPLTRARNFPGDKTISGAANREVWAKRVLGVPER